MLPLYIKILYGDSLITIATAHALVPVPLLFKKKLKKLNFNNFIFQFITVNNIFFSIFSIFSI
jgi:hypothetical protein